METIFIALGSNIDPVVHLPEAVVRLTALGAVIQASRVCQSPPVGFLEQADFCNAAVMLRSSLEPVSLRKELRAIEHALGRRRDPSNKNAPRTIDLDIALFGQRQIQHDQFTVPDPEIPHRVFLAAPLAELAPEYVLPGDGRRLDAIAQSLLETEPLSWRDDIQLQP